MTVPIIDISPLLSDAPADWRPVADAIGAACREMGFFAVVEYGVFSKMLIAITDQTSGGG